MISHYFKIAFRGYLNNKTQSLITLFSLAIAFALVSLAAYWNHYEQTYDSFITGYERIHLVGHKLPGKTRTSNFSYYGLHSHLMEKYPEVDKACGIKTEWQSDAMVEINNHTIQASCEKITPETIDVLGIQWVEGNRDMESWNENEVAISEQIARQVSEKDSPVGLELILKDENGEETTSKYRIAAVFKTWSQHSNFDFNILKKFESNPSSYKPIPYYTYLRFKPDTDVSLFLRKMAAAPIIDEFGLKTTYNALIPLKNVHYTFPKKERNLRLNDVKLFTGAGMLLSFCALLNYLTLFVSRLRTKGRDMALRAICGSSSWQLGVLLIVEYLLLLLGALLFSLMFIEIFYNGFIKLSQLTIDRVAVYTGCGYLLLFILCLAALLSLVPIFYFKNKTLRVQIDSAPVRLGRNRFRIAGVCLQLFISLLFIFCSTVMIKQIHYLIHADINMERKNIAWISAPVRGDVIKDKLKQIPSVTEMVTTHAPLFPEWNIHEIQIRGSEDFKGLVIDANKVYINQEIARFYGLKMKKGSESFDLKEGEVLINETFAKQLEDPNPIGKILLNGTRKHIIRGVVQDFHYQNPTKPTPALIFFPTYVYRTGDLVVDHWVLFKYTGDFADCQKAIFKALKDVPPETDTKLAILFSYVGTMLLDGETVYKSYLTSEINLLKLLNIITIISVLIALFGVYALILQECERQRKNIAIRKVYGAQIKDILMMFFKEYMLQVALAAAFAFPIGYVLMKHWLEGYSRQTNIGIEVFLGIFVGMSLLVLLCIGWHVWRAANENPATAVKKE